MLQWSLRSSYSIHRKLLMTKKFVDLPRKERLRLIAQALAALRIRNAINPQSALRLNAAPLFKPTNDRAKKR